MYTDIFKNISFSILAFLSLSKQGFRPCSMKKYEKLQLLYILADMNNTFYNNHSSFTIMIIIMNSTLSVHKLELLFIFWRPSLFLFDCSMPLCWWRKNSLSCMLVYCHLVIWHTLSISSCIVWTQIFVQHSYWQDNKYKYNNKITVKKKTLAVDKHWYGSLRNIFGVNAWLGYQEESVYAKHPQPPTCS